MAEEKEIFNSLDDGLGNGLAPSHKKRGGGFSDPDMQAVVVATDASDNCDLLSTQDEGNAVPSKGQGVMAVKDENGNLQYIPMNDGAVVVTSEGQGYTEQGYGSGTVTTSGTEQLALEFSLTPNRVYKKIEITASSFKDCTWRIEKYQDSGGGPTPDGAVLPGRIRTGAGQYSISISLDNLEFISNPNTPTLRVYVTQRAGTGSDFDVCVGVVGYD